jgi:pyruvate dehydrogenase E2 component (dihydrolipoamide acetyltransferase)
MADITMPQLGETVTEGTITRWAKQVGDKVDLDEILFEVSTDKVDSEVPSAAAGYVAEILVPEGETVDVGTRLAVISDAPPGGGAGAQPSERQAAPEQPAPEAAAPDQETPDQDAPAQESPAQEAPAQEAPAQENVPDAEPDRAPAPQAAPAQAEVKTPPGPAPRPAAPAAREQLEERGPGAAGDGDNRLLSPVVRRLIAEHKLDPATITGTGAGGRITRDDVLGVIDAKAGGADATPPAAAPPAARQAPQAPASAPAPAAPRPPAQEQPPTAPRDREEVVPFSKIRKITAEHMVRSKATSAHTLVVVEVDYEAVDKVRRAQRDSFKASEGHSLTYLPFISRAVVDAIEEFPHVNASVGNDELIVHRYLNLGIAVDLNFEGLLVPVIHDADTKRLRAIAREINDLATRARTKRLTTDDIAGGTFTLTNAGPFGTLLTAAVINQPQVAILSTDGVKKKPVAVELPDGSDAIVVHPVGLLALTFDHRAFDGAYAAAFVARVREILETRDWSQEL